jgi:predicted metal-dependent phosphoesterase TrpH
MTPPAIVASALAAGVEIVAIADHNAAGNVKAVTQAAAGVGLLVVAGLELTTVEECHILGLFESPDLAMAAAAAVQADLPAADEAYFARFGSQDLLDATANVLARERRMLAQASRLKLEQAVELIHRLGGLAVASHVDRPSNSVVSQLGFIPADAGLDGVEVSTFASCERTVELEKQGFVVIRSSDAHFLEDVGSARTMFRMNDASFAELKLAFRAEQGRRVAVA